MGIIADILKHAQSPTRKTRIMHKCNLSFNQIERYLSFLKKRTLIQSKNRAESIVYQTTKNGQEFLRRFFGIVQLLRSP